MSPVLWRPPRAPRSHPIKSRAQAPGVGKGTTASGKPTGARRVTGPDEAGAPRGATRHAREACRRPQPSDTNRCQATTATGCRKPGKGAQHTTNNGTAPRHVCVPRCGPSPCRLRKSCRPDGRVRARRVPSPCRLRSATIRMDECAPGSEPSPYRLQIAAVRIDE